MTCRECELLLAEGAECAEHLRVCAQCRWLAGELLENAAALNAMRDEEFSLEQASAYKAAFSLRPRPAIWIGAAAAAAVVLLALPSLWPHKSAPVIAPLPPLPVTATVPELPVLAAAAPALVQPRKTHRQKTKPEPVNEETMLVKMLTADPDVVVYWIVDPKEKAE